jgi:hypothetical protein
MIKGLHTDGHLGADTPFSRRTTPDLTDGAVGLTPL